MPRPRTSGFKSPKTVAFGLRARAWWVIRKNKVMTLRELMMTLNDGNQRAAGSNLDKYLRRLTDAGILRSVKLPVRPVAYRYTLVKDLGPKAPIIRESTREVFDPNSGGVFSLGGSVLRQAQDERGGE